MASPFRYLISVTVATVLLVACSGTSADQRAAVTTDQFWHSLRVSGDEVEGFGSIADMRDSADLVVLGRLVDPRLRTVRGNAAEDAVGYLQMTVLVREVLDGDQPAGDLVVEFLLPTNTPREAAAELEGAVPAEDAVLFLRAKRGDGESGLYRPVNSLGLWTETSRSRIDAPLSDEAPDEGPYETELDDVATLTEFVDYVEAR